MLISVILSAQATDKSVNLATAKLFPVANTPEELSAQIKAEIAKWGKVIRDANIRME